MAKKAKTKKRAAQKTKSAKHSTKKLARKIKFAKKTSKKTACKRSKKRKPTRLARAPAKTRFDPSQARMELRRLLIALNKTNARDKIGLALLRDELNDFAEKLKRSDQELYTEFELEIKLIYERVFNKLTGEHVFVE